MPEAHGIFDSIPQPVLGPDSTYIQKTGREIFEELSITGLNRSPIETLGAFITADSELSGGGLWPEIPLDVMCERILVDGSFAVRVISEKEMQEKETLDEPYEFLEDTIEIHRRLVTQRLHDKDGRDNGVVRVWQQTNTNWLVRDVKNYGQNNEQVLKTAHYPLEAFYPYPNGQGLLYHNQKTYRRLEEIEDSIRQQTGPASLSLIVTGYAGDFKRAQDTFAKGARVIGIPGNASVTRVASNNTADQLMANSLELRKAYIENMHLIIVNEAAVLSGKSRIIAMKPTLNYVATVRTMLDEIYKALGYKVEWGGIDVTDTSEKVAELNFLESGKRALILSIQEFMRKARALFGLTGEPVGDMEEPKPEPEPIEEIEPNDTGEPQ